METWPSPVEGTDLESRRRASVRGFESHRLLSIPPSCPAALDVPPYAGSGAHGSIWRGPASALGRDLLDATRAEVAQLAERLPRKEIVGGSIPPFGSVPLSSNAVIGAAVASAPTRTCGRGAAPRCCVRPPGWAAGTL